MDSLIFVRNFENTRDLPQAERMTLDGAVNKTGVLLALCFGGAFVGWNIPVLAIPCLIIGTILAFVTIFRSPAKAGSTAPFYAAFEGVALGGITVLAEMQYPGIGIQAIGLTFGILASLLFCYKSGIIKPTENFKRARVTLAVKSEILPSGSLLKYMVGSCISKLNLFES